MRRYRTRKGTNCFATCTIILGGLGLIVVVVTLTALLSPYICGLGALAFATLAILGGLAAALRGNK